jgi:hypothetical protein
VAEEVLETEAVEVELAEADVEATAGARPLPATSGGNELSPWRGEVRAAALAAAGGLVAGAATAVVVRASRGSSGRKPTRRATRKERPVKVLASRSFMVDVHLLDR